jgi:hypothetical protein
MRSHRILILGASYGSLLGVKLALAGHSVSLVCLPHEAALINEKGAVVRMPVKGREGLVEINSAFGSRQARRARARQRRPRAFDLVGSRCRSRSTARPACASCSRASRARACRAFRS